MEDISTHPLTLRFVSRHREAAFRRAYARDSLRQVRWALLLGVVLYGPLFGAMDVVNAPQIYHVAWTVRFGVCLVAVGVYLFTFSRYATRHLQAAVSGLMLLGGLGLVGLLILEGTGSQFFTGPALVILAAYVAIRLRFIYSTAVGWVTTLAYAAVAVLFREEGPGFVASSIWFMVSANIIGMFAAYGLESFARRDFCQVRGLDAKRRQLEVQASVLEKTNEELQRTLQDLTQTQDRLVHAKNMASLGALTAGIAHTIKNPLNFVVNFAASSRGLVEDLEGTDHPHERQALLSDVKENLDRIEEHGRRADRIVRGMMAHARGGPGERAVVDFNRLVDHFVDVTWHGRQAQDEGASVEVVRDYGEGIGEVEVVPQEVGRAIANLLSNAFDAVAERAAAASASGDGTYAPRVTVSTRRSGGAVEARVTDNGSGVSEDVRERVFEPFFTTKPTGAGTGLGLSMSYDIVVRGHGGALAVESDEGEGTAFVMTLPAAAQRPPASAPGA